jgi:hypothetical protein
MIFVTVGITNPFAEYGNVFTKGLCTGFYLYLVGKVKRTNHNEGKLIIYFSNNLSLKHVNLFSKES